MPVNANFYYKTAKDASYVTLRNQNRMLYANYRIQQNNVQQGCQIRVGLENGGVADYDIIPKLLEGALATTAAEIQIDISSAACPVTTVPVVNNPYASDKIYQSLTTSQAAYQAAAIGTWVSVTSAEYTTLQTNVASTSIAGVNNTDFESTFAGNYSAFNLIVANRSNAVAAAVLGNTYLYAFAIVAALPTISRALDSIYVYTNGSTSTYSGFSIVGSGPLPSLVAGRNYFVRKGVAAVSAATDGLLAISAPGDGTAAGSQSYNIPYSTALTGGGFQVSYGAGVSLPATSSTSLTNFANTFTVGVQALTTSSIQWVT